MKTLFYFLLFTILYGCATAPIDAPSFNDVNIEDPTEGNSMLVLYRKTSPPYGYDMRVHLNGTKITHLPNEAFTWIEVSAGSLEIEISWPVLALMHGSTIEKEILPNKQYYIELGGNMTIFASASSTAALHNATANERLSEEAAIEILSCCRYVPSKPL